jgi:hypothetical protein
MEIWNAILGGFKIFMHWQLYVVGFCYFSFFIGCNWFCNDTNVYAKKKPSFISRLFISSLNLTALFFCITILAPLLLGISNNASWSYPFLLFAHNPLSAAGILFVIIIFQCVIGIIPFIRELPSIQTLLAGAITLIYFMENMITSGRINISKSFKDIVYMPHGIELLIFFVICILFTHLGALLSMLTISICFKKRNTITVPAMSIYAMSGFIPVFIYGAWLGNQLK